MDKILFQFSIISTNFNFFGSKNFKENLVRFCMYQVYKLPIFEKRIRKLFNPNELIEINNFIEKLKINPNIGKPLYYPFLREKKIKGKRIYFLVYNEICIVLLVSASNKKTQQENINEIKLYLDEYKELVYQLCGKRF